MSTRLALALLAASTSHAFEPFFRYTSPSTNRSLSVCICAKCGSSSVYNALHLAILARKKRPGPPSIHSYGSWGAPGVAQSAAPGDVHVWVTRDPIERYLSAFHNKLRCCPGTRVRCCPSGGSTSCGHGLARSLLRLAGNASGAQCLHMDGYAHALGEVHRMRQQRLLDEHFLPQHLGCPLDVGGAEAERRRAHKGRLVLRGNVSALTASLAQLRGYAFRGGAILVRSVRRTARNEGSRSYELSDSARRELCALSRAEYRALSMHAPALCAQ